MKKTLKKIKSIMQMGDDDYFLCLKVLLLKGNVLVISRPVLALILNRRIFKVAVHEKTEGLGT